MAVAPNARVPKQSTAPTADPVGAIPRHYNCVADIVDRTEA